eukprot:EG_transcript_11447
MAATAGVTVEVTAQYGRSLVATRAFEAGHVVVREAPLLVATPLQLDRRAEQWCEAHDEVAPDSVADLLGFVKAFCAAPKPTQRQVLDCYAPSPLELSTSPTLCQLVPVAGLAAQQLWAKGHRDDTLRKVVLVALCNAQKAPSFGPNATAVFATISRCAHDCGPSAAFSSGLVPGCGALVARRAILPGDMVTIAYCEIPWPAPLRLEFLRANYLFDCRCSRCAAGDDVTRALPCPKCCPRDAGGLLSTVSLEAEDLGYILPGPGASPVWRCVRCDHTTATSGAERFEAGLMRVVRSLFDDGNNPFSEPGKLLELFDACRTTLGPRHWATVQCRVLLCELWATQLALQPTPELGDRLADGLSRLLTILTQWVVHGSLGGRPGEYYRAELLNGALALVLGGRLGPALPVLEWCCTLARIHDHNDRPAEVLRCLLACRRGNLSDAQRCAADVMQAVLNCDRDLLKCCP